MKKTSKRVVAFLRIVYGDELEKDLPFLEEIVEEIFQSEDKKLHCRESRIIFVASLVANLKKQGMTEWKKIKKAIKNQCAEV